MPRNLSIAVLATVSTLIVAGIPSLVAAREAIQDNYCLQGRKSGYPGNCQFSSYRQCLATASGTGERCGINPMKAYAQQRRGAKYQGRY